MRKPVDDIREYFESHHEELFDTLDQLLRVQSLSGTLEQNTCLDIVRAHIVSGVEIDDWVPDWDAVRDMPSPIGRQMYVPLERTCGPAHAATVRQTRCLVASTGTGHPHLVFNAHVDVVPANSADWARSPFEPAARDGMIVARGAIDMKAGLAAALFALNAVAELRLLPQGRLSLAVVPEEETGGNGTLACVERGHIGDGAIFIEQSDLEAVHRHLGIQSFEITALGREGNMLRRGPAAGINAIDVMGAILVELQEESDRRLDLALAAGGYRKDDHPAFINVGSVTGGEWIATRARECRAEGLFSILPDETIDEAEQRLRDAVNRGTARIPGASATIAFGEAGHQGGELPADHSLVQALVAAGRDLRTPVPSTRAGAMVCDAKILHGGGWAPAVIFGPRGGGPHAADEYVDAESVVECGRALALAAVHYCGR